MMIVKKPLAIATTVAYFDNRLRLLPRDYLERYSTGALRRLTRVPVESWVIYSRLHSVASLVASRINTSFLSARIIALSGWDTAWNYLDNLGIIRIYYTLGFY